MIYLASPFFTPEQRANVEEVAKFLRGCGEEVYVPMEHDIPNAWEKPNHQWSHEVFIEDTKAIRESNKVIAITYGMEDDAGTSWEIGFAYGLNKEIIVIPINNTTYSLMVYQSANAAITLDNKKINLCSIQQS